MYYTFICLQTHGHKFLIFISRVWKTGTNVCTIKQILKKYLKKTQMRTIPGSQEEKISSWLAVVKKRQLKNFGSVLCPLESMESE